MQQWLRRCHTHYCFYCFKLDGSVRGWAKWVCGWPIPWMPSVTIRRESLRIYFVFVNASSANNASAFGKLYTCTQLIHAHLVRRCVHTPRHWDFHYNLFRMRRNARCAATYTNTNWQCIGITRHRGTGTGKWPFSRMVAMRTRGHWFLYHAVSLIIWTRVGWMSGPGAAWCRHSLHMASIMDVPSTFMFATFSRLALTTTTKYSCLVIMVSVCVCHALIIMCTLSGDGKNWFMMPP